MDKEGVGGHLYAGAAHKAKVQLIKVTNRSTEKERERERR